MIPDTTAQLVKMLMARECVEVTSDYSNLRDFATPSGKVISVASSGRQRTYSRQIQEVVEALEISKDEFFSTEVRRLTRGVTMVRTQTGYSRKTTRTSSVLKALRSTGRAMNAGEIISWLEGEAGCEYTVAQVNQTCSYMLLDGRLERCGQGFYRAP